MKPENHLKNHYTTILGIIFVLLGILGFLFQGMIVFTSTTTAKNASYLIFGGIFAAIGVWGTTRMIQMTLRICGMLIFVVGVLNFMQAQPVQDFLSPTLFDATLHVITGMASLFVAKLNFNSKITKNKN